MYCPSDSDFRDADVTPFIHGHLDAQVRQVRTLDLRINTEQQVWMAVEEAAEAVGMDRRLADALWDAFFGRDMTDRLLPLTNGREPGDRDEGPHYRRGSRTPGIAGRASRASLLRRREAVNRAVAETLFIEIETASSARDRIITELGRRLAVSGVVAHLD